MNIFGNWSIDWIVICFGDVTLNLLQ